MTEKTLTIRLTADGKQLTGTLKVSKKELKSLGVQLDKTDKTSRSTGRGFNSLGKEGNKMGLVFGRLVGGVGIGTLAALMISGTKAAAEFEKKMAEVSTLLSGDIAGSMAELTDGVRELSIEYGGDVIEQSSALYQVISAGASDSAEALTLMDAANKLAIGGVTDVATAADGLTSALNAYGAGADEATDFSDAMFVAMKNGKTTIGELSTGMSLAAPIASQLGVSFDELLASVSAITTTGTKTTVAFTQMRQIMVSILKPSKDASDAAARMGLDFSEAGLRSKGFAGFMKAVAKATGGSKEEMAKLFPEVESLSGVMFMAGQGAAALGKNIEDMGNKAGATAESFAKMTAAFDYQWNVLTANLKNVGLSLGDGILPPLTSVITSFNELFALLNSEVSTGDKFVGWIHEVAGQLESASFVFGPFSAAAEIAAQAIQMTTTSSKDLVAEQKALNLEFAKGEAIFDGLKTAAEQYAEIDKDLDALFKSELFLGKAMEETTGGINKQSAATKLKSSVTTQINKDLDKLIKSESALFGVTDNTARVMKKYGFVLKDVSQDQVVLDRLLDSGRITFEQYSGAVFGGQEGFKDFESQAIQSISEVDKFTQNFYDNAQRGFGDLIYKNFKTGFDDWSSIAKDTFNTIRDGLYRLVADMIARWAILKVAGVFGFGNGGGGFSVGGGSGGGFGGQIVNAGIGSAASSSFGGAAGSAIGAGGGAGLYASSGLAADSWLGANVAYGAGDVGAGVSGLTYGSGAGVGGGAVSGGALAPEVVSSYEAGTAAAEGYSAAQAGVAESSSVAGGAVAAWGAVAMVAYIVIADAIRTAGIDKENAKLTDGFNKLRTETDAFAGEGVKVSDTLNIIGDEAGRLYIRLTENENGMFPDVSTFYDQLGEVGAQLRYIYDDTGEAIAMITGNIEDAQAIIEQGFDNATLSFTEFQGATEDGLTSMTATFRGDTEKWKSALQSAMDSGAVSTQASFQVIEDDAGNTFLQMQGQANEWANYLASQGRIAADSFAGSMNFMFAEGDNMFGNLTSQAQAFQSIVNGIKGPSLTGSFNGSVSGGGSVPGFASGGISYGPQLAYVSEGRYSAEAHVPLPDGRSIPVSINGGGDSKAVVAAISKLGDRVAAVERAVLGVKESTEGTTAAVHNNTEQRPDDLRTGTRHMALVRVGVV